MCLLAEVVESGLCLGKQTCEGEGKSYQVNWRVEKKPDRPNRYVCPVKDNSSEIQIEHEKQISEIPRNAELVISVRRGCLQ